MTIKERFEQAKLKCSKEAKTRATADREKAIEAMKKKAAGENVRIHDGKPYLEHLNDLASKRVKNDIQMEIGGRLRDWREKAGLKLENISRALSDTYPCDVSTINRWENGKRAIDIVYLASLAENYDIDLQWIITGTNQAPYIKKVKDAINKIIEAAESLKKIV